MERTSIHSTRKLLGESVFNNLKRSRKERKALDRGPSTKKDEEGKEVGQKSQQSLVGRRKVSIKVHTNKRPMSIQH